MGKKMWLEYPSEIMKIVSQNESFDACTIRVMYTGLNRNNSVIEKDAVERAIPSIYNVPIVCHYDVKTDTIGGHDCCVVTADDGSVKLVNLTDAVGVIPAGAEYRWETVEDDSGDHDYLVIDGLLWKRTPAYEKIKRDGITGQSMEITVTDGRTEDGHYEIADFTFTALCILGDGIEPCFESASLETFSLEPFKKTFSMMVEDFTREYNAPMAAIAEPVVTNDPEGGKSEMNPDEKNIVTDEEAPDVQEVPVEPEEPVKAEEPENAAEPEAEQNAEPAPENDEAAEDNPDEQGEQF